jgi:hypothetical protein
MPLLCNGQRQGDAAVLGASGHLLPSARCRRPLLLLQRSRRPRAGAREAGAGGQLRARLGRSRQQQRRMAALLQAPAARHAAGGCGGGGPARRRRSQGAIPACKTDRHRPSTNCCLVSTALQHYPVSAPSATLHLRCHAQPPRHRPSPPSASPSPSHRVPAQRRQPGVRHLQLGCAVHRGCSHHSSTARPARALQTRVSCASVSSTDLQPAAAANARPPRPECRPGVELLQLRGVLPSACLTCCRKRPAQQSMHTQHVSPATTEPARPTRVDLVGAAARRGRILCRAL